MGPPSLRGIATTHLLGMRSDLRTWPHFLVTTPTIVATVDAAVATAIVVLAGLAVEAPTGAVVAAGVVAFLVLLTASGTRALRLPCSASRGWQHHSSSSCWRQPRLTDPQTSLHQTCERGPARTPDMWGSGSAARPAARSQARVLGRRVKRNRGATFPTDPRRLRRGQPAGPGPLANSAKLPAARKGSTVRLLGLLLAVLALAAACSTTRPGEPRATATCASGCRSAGCWPRVASRCCCTTTASPAT